MPSGAEAGSGGIALMRLSGEDFAAEEPAVPSAPRAELRKEEMSRAAVALSVALHLAVGGLAVFGLPDLFETAPPQREPVAVDLVTIARETRATHPNPYVPRPRAKPDLPVADMPAPKPRPKPMPPLPAPPPSSGGAPAPPAQIEKAEWQPPSAPQPDRAEGPIVVPRPREKPQPPRLAKAEAHPRIERKTYNPGAFEALLRNLAPEHNAPSPDLPPHTERLVTAEASSQPQAPLGKQLTASEIDLIRRQIERCWNIPEGARDAKDLVVEIRVFVEPDGNVRQADILDHGRMADDPVFRAAADSARRALFNPLCRPLRLPPDKYESWKEFVVAFSPKDLL
jgi:hypothetical protein